MYLRFLASLLLFFFIFGNWGGVSHYSFQALADEDEEYYSEDDYSRDDSSDTSGEYIVIAYNDLGMHCMNDDFSVLSILPPYNTLMAQVIKKGEEPDIITKGIEVEYRLLENTDCQGTNFWDYVKQLFGMEVEHCTGLKGKGLSGKMELQGSRFVAEGLPVTPFNNNGQFNPYPIAEVIVKDASSGRVLAKTQTVVPVSHEMNCHECHGGLGGAETMMNILKLHDEEEGTNLSNSTPVLCQECHADNALGKPGLPGIPNLSLAIHGKHAELDQPPSCYDCHPGPVTQCLRTDIEGMQTCEHCHGNLQTMAASIREGRRPWLDEPKCSDCHYGSEMDTGRELYRNAQGHHGVYCETCHYEPHAWWPSKLARDNQQAIDLQGQEGPLGKNCFACHTSIPDDDDEEGPHGYSFDSFQDTSDLIYNLAPSTPINVWGTKDQPLSAPVTKITLTDEQKRKVKIEPQMAVPLERQGQEANLYFMVCLKDYSQCTNIIYIGRTILGSVAIFPILSSPVDLSLVEGDYYIFIGFAQKPEFSDVIYSFFEVDL